MVTGKIEPCIMLLLFLGVARFSYFSFKVLVLDGKSGGLSGKVDA